MRTVIKLNTNLEHVLKIKKALKENDGYCPCQLIKTKDTKCMCKSFREQKEGYCHCGLYNKEKIK